MKKSSSDIAVHIGGSLRTNESDFSILFSTYFPQVEVGFQQKCPNSL